MARRHRDALVCWYCQHCLVITGGDRPPEDSTTLPFPEWSSTTVPELDLLANPSVGEDLCDWAF
jgi:hypothetical protein